MPYPGGKHAPGHYISVGVAHLWSFISAASTILDPLSAPQDANRPASIAVNDLLHVSLQASPNIVTPAGWMLLFSGNLDAYWRIATADANDDFALPVGTDPSTAFIVIYSVFRRPGEVPDLIATSALDVVGGTPGPMNIADMAVDQSGIINPILIMSTKRAGQVPTQVPAYTSVPTPWRTPIDPIYRSWGGGIDRFGYLGTVYQLEAIGSPKPASAYTWSQFEGSAQATQSDSRGSRWDIV